MNRLLIAAAAFAAISSPALAADIVQTPALSWSGFYVGANGGAGYLDETTTDYNGYINGGTGGDFSLTGTGGLIGATLGYNVQYGQAVFGVEADIAKSSLSASRDWTGGLNTNQASWDWLGTLRARAGLAVGNALAYTTAGVAAVKTDYFYGAPSVSGFTASSNDVKWGFAAGAGVEYALDDNWSAKLEYLYVGLPTTKTTDGYDGPIDFKSSANIARLGLNYRF